MTNNATYKLTPLCTLVLLMMVLPVQAQTLRPSGQLRFSSPSVPALGQAGSAAQQQADFIVAVVNSEPITNNDVRSKMLRAEQQLTQQGAVMPPRAELIRQVLERVIGDKAQLQEAKVSGVRIDDNAVTGAVETVAQQNQMSVEELRRRLASDGIAYNTFREQLRDELLVSRFRQREVDARVKVTDLDIDQFLREQEGNNDVSSMDINLAQILVAVPENATPEQVKALEAKAQQAADKARSGVDFVTLVNEFSEAPLRATGGQMGGQQRREPLVWLRRRCRPPCPGRSLAGFRP